MSDEHVTINVLRDAVAKHCEEARMSDDNPYAGLLANPFSVGDRVLYCGHRCAVASVDRSHGTVLANRGPIYVLKRDDGERYSGVMSSAITAAPVEPDNAVGSVVRMPENDPAVNLQKQIDQCLAEIGMHVVNCLIQVLPRAEQAKQLTQTLQLIQGAK